MVNVNGQPNLLYPRTRATRFPRARSPAGRIVRGRSISNGSPAIIPVTARRPSSATPLPGKMYAFSGGKSMTWRFSAREDISRAVAGRTDSRLRSVHRSLPASGIPASVVSREGKVHVIWAEATDPDEAFPACDVRRHNRQGNAGDGRARAGRLRTPRERYPQLSQHHRGRAGLSACAVRHPRMPLSVRSIAGLEHR